MKTKLVLKLGNGNFQEGFPDSFIEVRPNVGGGQKWNCHLPPAPDLPPTYQKWQAQYRDLLLNQAPRGGTIDTCQTQYSEKDWEEYWEECCNNCENYYQELSTTINSWLNGLPVISQLKEILKSQKGGDDIFLEVNTQQITDQKIKYLLHQLHFESWDLFNSYRVENCLSLHRVNSNSPETPTEVKSKSVKILGIVGDDTGIDLTEDKKLIENLRLRNENGIICQKLHLLWFDCVVPFWEKLIKNNLHGIFKILSSFQASLINFINYSGKNL